MSVLEALTEAHRLLQRLMDEYGMSFTEALDYATQ
jgi:division protein CdvB (Snf7/Vps24/ESCRT-III family)